MSRSNFESEHSGGSPTTQASQATILTSNTPSLTGDGNDGDLAQHLMLLKKLPSQHEAMEVSTTPIFTMPVLQHAVSSTIPQYGLIGGLLDVLKEQGTTDKLNSRDPRIFFNVSTPSSTFICGSQGSGKSHTLSCLLENCLSSSDAGRLPKPVTGIIFHYDAFISDDGGSPCEAAFLSSDPQIQVRVLCSPSNIRVIRQTYQRLGIQVEPLQIQTSDLNTKRILDLMAVKTDEAIPLYVHTIYRILREMRIRQQALGGSFDYSEFKRELMDSGLSATQLGPLNQRLNTLESFMPSPRESSRSKGKALRKVRNDWGSKPGCLTIVDLSCPCITPESACALFNMCLSLFVEQSMDAGRVIALDEAHKYLNSSPEALALTETLLSVIRLQRHLGCRIIISTQEPTISTALLDLCSVTIAHRFTSPEWLRSLKSHLAAAATNRTSLKSNVDEGCERTDIASIFDQIVMLDVGEALLFAPSAIVKQELIDGKFVTAKLGAGFLKIRVRNRLTTDGGQSVMAI